MTPKRIVPPRVFFVVFAFPPNRRAPISQFLTSRRRGGWALIHAGSFAR